MEVRESHRLLALIRLVYDAWQIHMRPPEGRGGAGLFVSGMTEVEEGGGLLVEIRQKVAASSFLGHPVPDPAGHGS